MPKLMSYTPQSVMIPPDIATKYKTQLRNRIDSYPEEEAINGGYALLHDVFRTASDDKIIAIGTGWRDLKDTPVFNERRVPDFYEKKSLHQMRDELALKDVSFNGERLSVKYRTLYSLQGKASDLKFRPIVGVYEINMTPAMRSMDKFNLKLNWRDFSRDLLLKRNDLGMSKSDMILHTTQRDNHPLWITDWCNYYHRQHNVRRIVIYNNLDSNPNKFTEILNALPDDMEVLLIDWPYRYNYEIYFNLSQVVALNHCPLLLGKTGRYYLNFDIDEYLINSSGTTLNRLLDNLSKNGRRFSNLLLNHYLIPDLTTEKLTGNEPPRVWHYKHRKANVTRYSTKTINKYGGFDAIWLHKTTPKWPKWLQLLLRSRRFRVFATRVHRKYPRFLFPLEIDKKILYFNHYMALGSNWNMRRSDKAHSTEDCVADPNAITKSQIYDSNV